MDWYGKNNVQRYDVGMFLKDSKKRVNKEKVEEGEILGSAF